MPRSPILSTPISNNYTYSSLHASHSIINLPPQTVVVPKPVYQAPTLNTITFFPQQHSTILLQQAFSSLVSPYFFITISLLSFNVPLQSALILQYIFLELDGPISLYPCFFFYIPMAKAHSYIPSFSMPTDKQQRPLAYYHHYKYHNYLPQISLRLAFPISQITISNNFNLVKTTSPKETQNI